MTFSQRLADSILGLSVAAFVMAELNLTSLFGNWHPTHQTAIALGVISIALSCANRNATNGSRE